MLNLENPYINLKLKSLLCIIIFAFVFFTFSYLLYVYIIFDPNLNFTNTSSKVYDRDSELLSEISQKNSVRRTPVSFEQIPQSCIDAITSVEDKTFFTNIGVDINGIGRLAMSMINGGNLGGGSTISQQLIKNANQRIYGRNLNDKFTEIVQAIKLNSLLSKNEIITSYLNNIYFGNLNYGVESASIDYFGKSVSDLDTIECAYLMGIPQRPGIYNPRGNLSLGIERLNRVLLEMYKNKKITEEEFQILSNIDISEKINLQNYQIRAPHYIDFVSNYLTTNSSGENIYADKNYYTKYNFTLHNEILKILSQYFTNVSNVNNVSVILINNSGEIEVMIGSKNYFDDSIKGKFNSALGLRQPSSIYYDFLKPLSANVDVEYYNDSQTLNDSLFQKFMTTDNILVRIDPTLTARCNEKLLLEGCEISLLDLARGYFYLYNDHLLDPSDLIFGNKDFNTRKINTFTTSAVDIHNKDYFTFIGNEKFILGVWAGNTDGEPFEHAEINTSTEIANLISKVL
jgi:membrane peptidoglycan carboxypeptidase